MSMASEHGYSGFTVEDVGRFRGIIQDEYNVTITLNSGHRYIRGIGHVPVSIFSAFRTLSDDGMVLVASVFCLNPVAGLPANTGKLHETLERLGDILEEMRRDGTFRPSPRE